MTLWQKFTVSLLGVVFAQLSLVYTTHPDAPVMGYVAGIAGGLGAYLTGFIQSNGGPQA